MGRALARRAVAGIQAHPYHALLAAAVGGLALSLGRPGLILLCAAILAASGFAAGALRLGAAAGLVLVAGSLLGAARLEALGLAGGKPVTEAWLEATVELLDRPRPSAFGSWAPVEVTSGSLRGQKLLARAPRDKRWPVTAPGAELALSGGLRPINGPAAGDRGFAAYLRSQGIAATLDWQDARATGRRRGGLAGTLDRMRERAEAVLARGLSPPSAALIRGMVLGQDERITGPVRDDFRRSGLAHLLAVSGVNVMLLVALALPLLALVRVGRRLRVAVLLALIAIYVPLAGAEPSLQRAGVMGAAGLVAIAAGRPASRSYAVLLAAAVTLAVNPMAPGDPGWQLSFAAVVGIASLGPPLRRALAALPRALAEGAAVTVAATLATAPLLAAHFEAVSLVSLPANLIALPAVAPAMWIGMLQIAVGQFASLGGPGTAVAVAAGEVLGRLNALPLAYLAEVARRAAELPWAQARTGLGWPLGVTAAYAGLALLALVIRELGRRLGPAVTATGGHWRAAPRGLRRTLTVGALALALGAAAPLVVQPAPPDRLTVSFLDVGQGDATLVQHPDGTAVLFDGGPEEARAARLLRNAGVRRLDAVVATHASADHHGGLPEVFRRLPVDLLVDGGDGATDSGFQSMLAEAGRRGVRRIPARAGQALRLGGLTLRILAPPPRPPGPPPEDPNLRAVVALVSAGSFELLLSADAESPSLVPLSLPDVDAMKVPHHGSADPGLPAILARVRPQVAAIEVGENSYGHPAPSTLAALERSGARVYRTDRDGTISLTVDAGGLTATTER